MKKFKLNHASSIHIVLFRLPAFLSSRDYVSITCTLQNDRRIIRMQHLNNVTRILASNYLKMYRFASAVSVDICRPYE
jgi:hypothetical protein